MLQHKKKLKRGRGDSKSPMLFIRVLEYAFKKLSRNKHWRRKSQSSRFADVIILKASKLRIAKKILCKLQHAKLEIDPVPMKEEDYQTAELKPKENLHKFGRNCFWIISWIFVTTGGLVSLNFLLALLEHTIITVI